MLYREHPVLIYENVDKRNNTVTLEKAIERLKDISKINISDEDIRRIKHARKIRNALIHFCRNIEVESKKILFYQLFAFLKDFHEKYLGKDVMSGLKEDVKCEIAKNNVFFEETYKRIEYRLSEENLDADLITACPLCLSETFLIGETNKCLVCNHEDEVFECPYCNGICLYEERQDISEKWETDYSEGICTIHNTYEHDEAECCPECYPSILEKIKELQDEERYRQMEDDCRIWTEKLQKTNKVGRVSVYYCKNDQNVLNIVEPWK